MNLSLKRDVNGNKCLSVKIDGKRAFSVQTLGNLPITHSCDLNTLHNCPTNRARVINELREFIAQHGTKAQKDALQ
jgi:hypothetical protein